MCVDMDEYMHAEMQPTVSHEASNKESLKVYI